MRPGQGTGSAPGIDHASRATRGGRGGPSGFSLIELLVAMAVIGIIAAIAVPNFLAAMKKGRRTAACKSALQVEAVIQDYMIEFDGPPTTVNAFTLEPLVAETSMTEGEANAILSHFEDSKLIWYFGWTNTWGGYWDYDYGIAFRPKGDPDSFCILYPEATWCWYPGEGWSKVN